jgi:YVTN family beta-propeller protein
MSELPTGTVTFLFTDIEGSTQLLKRLGPAYAVALSEHQEIVRAAVAAHGGREVDTQGDSFFIAFPRAKDAVSAAVAIQRDLAAHAWPEGGELKIRIGLHTGEPQVGEQRYVGMGVNKAARIGAAGHGGQVLLSRTTLELVEDELPTGVTIRDLGERRLKDIERPERISQLVVEGLPSNFGQLKTLDVELSRKRRRMYAGAALIGVLAAAVAIPVFALGQGSGGGTTAAPNSVAIIDPESNTVTGSVPVGIRPSSITTGEGSVFVANTEDETVSRIDAGTRELIRTISVGEYPSDVAVADGSAWVALGASNQLRRIVLERNEAEEPFRATPAVEYGPIGGSLPCARSRTSLTVGGGAFWVVCTFDEHASDASRISVRTKRAERIHDALVSSSPVGVAFSDIAVGLGSAWIANRLANAVIQIDSRTLSNVREVTVGEAPEAVAVGFDSVWVANAEGGTVSRFDLAEFEERVVAQTIPVGDMPVDLAVGEDAVWVVNRGDRTISRIDPATNEVVATIELANVPVRVAAGEGAVWVTVQEPDEASS